MKDETATDKTPSQIEVVPCGYCAGYGYTIVTADMASDAGEPDMAGSRETCSNCNGCGQVQELIGGDDDAA